MAEEYQCKYVNINIDFAKEIRNGKNTNMPVWKFVEELNKFNHEAPAVITEARTYSYGQMFRKWERYARVFSALGITGEKGARACILYPDSMETLTALFGLNMVGTPISLMTVLEIFDEKRLFNTLKKEGITDLFMMDYLATPQFLRKIQAKRKKIGLRHIIVLKNSLKEVLTPFEQMIYRRNYEVIHRIPDIVFMKEELSKYKEYPIAYDENSGKKEAVIVHTSGTTKGIRKPIPFTNEQMNKAAFMYYLNLNTKEAFDYNSRVGLSIDLSGAYALMPQMLATLCGGYQLVINFLGMFDSRYDRIVKKYNIDYVTISNMTLDAWMKLPKKPDLSMVNTVALGGAFVSGEMKKRYNNFLKECGSKGQVIVGYGLSEVGGTVTSEMKCIEDDSVGIPAPGMKLKILDEETGIYHDYSEGPNIGGLYVHCDTISNGTVEGERYFDTVLIDGEEYLCTYDLVKVNENGTLSCLGRMNQFFINNEGVRFDAGLIENMLERQPGINACVVAPYYDKLIHDTIPILYVETADKKDALDTIIKALKKIFITDEAAKDTNLPLQVLLVNEMPRGQTGKIDRYKLNPGNDGIKRYALIPIKKDKTLTDIRLEKRDSGVIAQDTEALPDELQEANPYGNLSFDKLISSPEMLYYVSPLVISAVVCGRIIPENKKIGFQKQIGRY